MNDVELERLRRRRLDELSKSFSKKKKNSKQDMLDRIFVGRAWEVYNSAKAQYPQIAAKLRDVFIQLASSGKIERINGEELYYLFRRMGLRIRLKTKITIKEHGMQKSIEEKMKE